MTKQATKTPSYEMATTLYLDPKQVRADWTHNSRSKPKSRVETKDTSNGAVKTTITDGELDDLGNDTGSIEKLAESMKSLGQKQAVGVIGPDTKGMYDLVFGFRRFEAAKLAGLKLLATVMPAEAGKTMALTNFAENVARKQLHPYDIGRTCSSLLVSGLKGAYIAERVGLSRASVNNYGRIFEKVDQKILDYWQDVGHPVNVQYLLSIVGLDKAAQLESFRQVTEENAAERADGEAGTVGPVKQKTRKADDLSKMLALLEGGAFAHMDGEWVKGAVDALRYALKLKDGLTDAKEPTQSVVGNGEAHA